MAKKISLKQPVKRRANSMEKCLVEAEDYLRNNNKLKKIAKTKTMARTLEEGKKMLAKKSGKPPTNQTKPTKIKRRAIKSKSAGKANPRKQPTIPAVPPPAPPPTAPTTLRDAAASSGRPGKATTFKTQSKDHLPMSAFGFIDICFCVDSTGSMTNQLTQVQSTIQAIIERIQNKVRTEGVTLRFAVVAYRDHGDASLLEHQDFTDAEETIEYVKKLAAYGGGDEPEAAHDGLLDACTNLHWIELPGTPMLRYIFHVLDAPPHGKEFNNYELKEGCTCGKTTDQVAHEINVRQIHYRMIKVRNNAGVNRAEQILKGKLVNFDSADIAQASEMDVRVSEMIIHEIVPQT